MSDPTTEEVEARSAVDRITGWKHLRRYSGMSPKWMDQVRDAIVRAALEAAASVRKT